MRLSKKYGGIQFFAPALGDVVINFDSHISKVVLTSSGYSSGVKYEWTASGQSVSCGAKDGQVGLFTVTLENGYVIDTVTFDTDYATLDEKTDTSFTLTNGSGVWAQPITITSKQGGASTMSKSYDLSTSTKWANLADGDHVVKLRAKGAGYGSSSFSNSVTVKKSSIVMPVKGDMITIESKQYRVLKTNGSVAEVLAMYNASSSQKFDTNSSYNNTYAGKNIDTYCNNTFYSGLSSAMKTAIVDKTFTQDKWSWSSSVPTSSHYTGKYGSSTYYLTLTNAAFGTSITRHCYVLSVQDVLDYLDATTSMAISDTTLTDINIWKMVWNRETSPEGGYSWLRSARSEYSSDAFYVTGRYGYLGSVGVNYSYAVRPAFQIDLSKIEWTKQ